ncbi:MAG: carbohydrate-binding domain-containing protein [Lachnospiraceae bacterium]|nr:carbohydrate-binding domain-containing protein [Lachnospiraceae bacterium]
MKKATAIATTAVLVASLVTVTAFAAGKNKTNTNTNTENNTQIEMTAAMQPGELPGFPGEDGQAPQLSEQGQLPEQGQAPQFGEQGQLPEQGQAPQFGEQGQMPEQGQEPQFGDRGQMPEQGQAPQFGEQGQMPEQGQAPQFGEQGQMLEQGQAPAFGDQSQFGGMNEGSMPGDMSGQFPSSAPSGQQGSAWSSLVAASAGSATEVEAGTMTNSAASLTADYENAYVITMSEENNEVKIDEAGTYVITGTCTDGSIIVKKGTMGVVLVLKDLNLTSTTGAAVSINKETEVKLIISGSVTLTDNEDPADEDSADADVADAYDGAALKAKANSVVYVTGDGTLTIRGNAKNGIKGGDDASLIFDGPAVDITAANDGINVNYDLTLLSGSFSISAADDALHADRILTIGSQSGTGPTVTITKCTEGLEGTIVNLFGGKVSVTSSDDAVNAANADGTYLGTLTYSVNMTGGSLSIKSSGDGIDSNGNVNLIAGSATIQSAIAGGEAGIDYDGSLYISDTFVLNNQSGVAGPDNMGGMPGQMGGKTGQMPGQSGSFSGMPGESGTQPGQDSGFSGQTGQMPGQTGDMGGQAPGQTSGSNGRQSGSGRP